MKWIVDLMLRVLWVHSTSKKRSEASHEGVSRGRWSSSKSMSVSNGGLYIRAFHDEFSMSNDDSVGFIAMVFQDVRNVEVRSTARETAQ